MDRKVELLWEIQVSHQRNERATREWEITCAGQKTRFLKNKPEKLLIIKNRPLKQTQIDPKTKPALLLKIKKGEKTLNP